jgi:hypothetical protein
VVAGGELGAFLGRKIQTLRGGVATPGCPAAGLRGETVVPRTSPCTGNLRHGGKRTLVKEVDGPGVMVAVVTAVHSNGASPNFLGEPERTELSADALTAYVGPEIGFVLRFWGPRRPRGRRTSWSRRGR